MDAAAAFAESYLFNLHALPVALAALALLFLGLLSLWHDHRSLPTQCFFLFVLSLAHYYACFAMASLSASANTALFWVRLGYVGVPLVPVLLFSYVSALQESQPGAKGFLIVGWSLGGFFILAALTGNWLIAGVERQWWGYYKRYGVLGFFFLPFCVVYGAMCGVYYRRLLKATPIGSRGRLRLKLHVYAMLVGCLITVDFLAGFGLPVYPFGYLSALSLVALLLLAMQRYGPVMFTPMLPANMILETMGEVLLVVDEDEVIRRANLAAEELLRRPRTQFINQPLVEFLALPRFHDGVIRAFGGEHHIKFETDLADEAGSCRTMDISGTRLTNNRNESIGAFFLLRDVTRERQIQMALRRVEEEEERFRSTFDQAPIGAAMLSLDHRFLRVNAALCRITGYMATELTTMSQAGITHPDDYAAEIEQARQLVEGQLDQYTMEARYLRKDGGEAWVRISARLLRDAAGKPVCLLHLIEDITEGKLAAQALDKVNKLLNETQALTKVGGWEFDTATQKLSWTDEVFHIYGLAPGNYPHGVPEALSFYHPEDRQALERAFNKCLTTGEPYEIDLRFTRANGEALWVRTAGRAVREEGTIIRLSGNFMDISERKRAELEKTRLEAQLLHGQKIQAVGTLAGGIAHEFNNLLAIIVGFAELAKDTASHGENNTGEIDHITRAADRASALVRQMLAFSRKAESKMEPLDLNKLVVGTKRMLEHTLPRNISIESHLEPGLPILMADGSQMEQILVNLATNARDAMPEGGRLSVTTRQVALPNTNCATCGMEFSGAHILLAVEDSGQGMDREIMGQIFEPFFTTKGVGKGTGLGLSVVLGLVHEHGGHLNCTSRIGSGTNISIYLPVTTGSETVPEDTRPALKEMPGGNETVLVVDDEEDLLEIEEGFLTAAGYKVVRAGSGEQALQLYGARVENIDLVIMDLGMPGMGGMGCIKELLALNPKAKIIVATGYAEPAREKESREAGASAYVAKPYRGPQLLQIVREVLDRPQ